MGLCNCTQKVNGRGGVLLLRTLCLHFLRWNQVHSWQDDQRQFPHMKLHYPDQIEQQHEGSFYPSFPYTNPDILFVQRIVHICVLPHHNKCNTSWHHSWIFLDPFILKIAKIRTLF